MKFLLNLKPLSLNNCYSGRRFRTLAKKQYDRTLQLLLPRAVVDGPCYKVTFQFFLKECFRVDVDNLAKGLLDNIVEKGIISNDRRVTEIHLYKHVHTKDMIEVDIEKAGVSHE